jgi:EmrB/QacA subfamily drug resistance transporter
LVTVQLEGKRRTAFVATLLTGTFSMSISQSALSTAYPSFMHAFGVSADTVAWLTTGFMLMMTLMIPVSPWLLSNLPFKRLFQAVELIFAVGTALCVWAPSFPVLLAGRLLEAIGVGVIFPSFQTVLLTITPENARGAVMGTAGLVMGSALAVGPIISGVLLTWFSWQALFVLFLIVALGVLLVSTATISSVMPQEPRRLDWLSFGLSAGLPLTLLALSMLTKGQERLGGGGLLLIGVLLIVAFTARQLRLSKPMLELRVLGTGMFRKAVLLTGISYVALIVTTILMPLYFQTVLKVSPLVSGLSLVPAAVLLSLLNPLSGRMLDQFGPRRVAAIGMILIIGGFGLLALFSGRMSLPVAIILAACCEAGNAFVMMPSVTAGANALPAKLVPDGTAVTTTARQLFGSAGVLLATVLLANLQLRLGVRPRAFALTFALFALIGLCGLLLALSLPRKLQTRD